MTDTQLYLAIGVPSALFALNFVTVLVGILINSRQLDSFRSEMLARLNALEKVMDAKFEAAGAKIDALSMRVKALEDEIRSPLAKR